jgi:hypothetical protein
MSIRTLSSELRTGSELLLRTVDVVRAVTAAVGDAHRAIAAYNSGLAQGIEPATAAAAAVMLERKAA